MGINDRLLSFLDKCHSQYHVIENITGMLAEAGFTEVTGNTLPKAGGRYYITRNYSSVIAFCMPKSTPAGFLVSASHSDSPTFKIKNAPEIIVEKNYVKLNIERYGGMLCAPWFDRPLTVAGKVLVSSGNEVLTRLVYIDKDLLIIPNVAIHMNRNANTGYEYKANVDMLPLMGGIDSKDAFMRLIAENAGCRPEDIIGTDLYLCVREKSIYLGANSEFIASARLDDLECVYTTLEAFLDSKDPETHATVLMVADNEEIGSDTKQGAGSPMLRDCIDMISKAYGMTNMQVSQALENSFMLSCDNAHAVHPNHPELADKIERPYINGGIVLKYGIRYATDAVAEALFRRICALCDVPVQTFSNRPDMAGGATLGNISNTKVAMNTVDIGLAQLAMHSCYETAGAKDAEYMTRAVTAFYNSAITYSGRGNYTLTIR